MFNFIFKYSPAFVMGVALNYFDAALVEAVSFIMVFAVCSGASEHVILESRGYNA